MKQREEWRAQGIDPCHTPEARKKMSEFASESNKLKPRKGHKRQKEAQ